MDRPRFLPREQWLAEQQFSAAKFEAEDLYFGEQPAYGGHHPSLTDTPSNYRNVGISHLQQMSEASVRRIPEEYRYASECKLCLGHRKLKFTSPEQDCPLCVRHTQDAPKIRMACSYCGDFHLAIESVFPDPQLIRVPEKTQASSILAYEKAIAVQTCRFCSLGCLAAHFVVKMSQNV